MNNTFGQLFRATTCGESHGAAIAAIIDGCPAGLKLNEADIEKEFARRKTGQSKMTSARKEADKVQILSGVSDGKTIGTPILLLIYNQDARSKDYRRLKKVFRPSHADYTYLAKYGIREYRGGGRSSARETLARVAAGAVAQKYLKEKLGIEFLSFTEQVGDIKTDFDFSGISRKKIESNIIRCPDKKKAQDMIALVEKVRKSGDSIGGVIKGVIKNTPAGLGEPVFDRLEADLAKAMLGINATKGFEIGSGFGASAMRGSKHNDEFYIDDKRKIRTKTNRSGGVLGGISNGEDIYFRVAFKPTATISQEQSTINEKGEKVRLKAAGRHDPCVAPRAVPIVDAMAALVVMDHYLRQKVNLA